MRWYTVNRCLDRLHLKTPNAAEHRIPSRDHVFLRELHGQRPRRSFEKILRKALRVGADVEREARIYYRVLPAPALLGTKDPYVDDDLLAALIQIRGRRARWEAAWHLRGNIRVTPGHPLVFVSNCFFPASEGFDEDMKTSPIWRNYARRLIGRPTLCVDRAILLRDFWENYWHLLHDILPRLVMAEAINIDPTIPVVVSENMMKWHGKRLSDTPFLKGRKVIVQPEFHTLCCKELFLLRPGEFAQHWTERVVTRIAEDRSAASGSRYIYCRREPGSAAGRTLENSLEIEEIFKSAGFAVVDPAPMTLNQQKAIFEKAEIIAGINGAAFTNALFRYNRPLTIGALISSNWMSTTLPTMAKVFGFGYTGFVVAPVADGTSSPVLVPPDTARRLIERILTS